jgi:hypothetical protein
MDPILSETDSTLMAIFPHSKNKSNSSIKWWIDFSNLERKLWNNIYLKYFFLFIYKLIQNWLKVDILYQISIEICCIRYNLIEINKFITYYSSQMNKYQSNKFGLINMLMASILEKLNTFYNVFLPNHDL